MRDVKMTTSFVAPLARRDKTTIYQWFNTPECQSWLPPKTGIGESRTFNLGQTVLLMIHSDLNRWGIPVPMAGKLVGRMAELLAKSADSPIQPEYLSVGFFENGASFCDLAPADSAKVRLSDRGAGNLRFVLQIDIREYREVVETAIDAETQVIGVEDAAA